MKRVTSLMIKHIIILLCIISIIGKAIVIINNYNKYFTNYKSTSQT